MPRKLKSWTALNPINVGDTVVHNGVKRKCVQFHPEVTDLNVLFKQLSSMCKQTGAAYVVHFKDGKYCVNVTTAGRCISAYPDRPRLDVAMRAAISDMARMAMV